MLKQTMVLATATAVLAGCGGTGPLDSTGAPPDEASPEAAAQPDDTMGGFGSPSRVADEFQLGPGGPVSGTLRLADDGCWYVEFEAATALAILPVGFEIPFQTDPTILVGPDAQEYGSGTAIDGMVHQVPREELPGGGDGRWGNYVTFCDPAERSVAVFEDLWPADDPMALSEAEVTELVASAAFSIHWPCGRGWAASTEDETVGLFVYQQSSERLEAGATVELSDEGWTARVLVGKHLFVNHCDDVFEPWDPDQVIAADWPLTAGALKILDTFPAGDASASVRAVLSGGSVTTTSGATIDLGDVELANPSFNAFAG